MKINKKLFRTICEIQSVSYDMNDISYFIYEYLTENNILFDVDIHGNIYINRDYKNVPCMVAHLDTVHELVEDLTVFECGNIWTGINRKHMIQTGIGGDDKVGIYITLELLKIHKIKAAFFVNEEVGCLGSFKSDITFFKDCLYVLQCDRRGNSDFVTNINGEISSKPFQRDIIPIIKKYKYSFSNGMITDVGQLSQNKIGVSCANISCGYYNPHSENEYIMLNDVLNCMTMCSNIFTNITKQYKHEFKAEKYNNWIYEKSDLMDWRL